MMVMVSRSPRISSTDFGTMKVKHFSAWLLATVVLTVTLALTPRCKAATGYNSGPAASVGQIEAKSLVGKRAKHETDLFTGAFVYSIPIEAAPARNGSQPSLNLVYSSSGENGWCGLGWNLDIGYIERNTKDGIPVAWNNTTAAPLAQYDDSKGFTCSMFGRQVRLLAVGSGEYRAEVDTDFTRYFFDSGNNRWYVYDKGGNLYRFGYGDNSRLTNTKSGWGNNATGTFRWALDEIITASGDRTTVSYQTFSTADAGTIKVLYPQTITYNGHVDTNGNSASQSPTHSIEFTFADRNDKRISYRSGLRVVIAKRLSQVLCKVGTQSIRRYDLGYDYSASTKRSRLTSITLYGYDASGANPVAFPSQSFTYQDKPLAFEAQTIKWADMNIPDSIYARRSIAGYNAYSGEGISQVTDLVDIDGDGLPDRVRMKETNEDQYQSGYNKFKVQRNLGIQPGGNGAFEATDWNWSTTIDSLKTSAEWSAINSQFVRFLDIDGDGRPDRVLDDYWHIYYPQNNPNYGFQIEFNTGSSFSSDSLWSGIDYQGAGNGVFRTIESGSNVRMIDMNGDGRPDRVMKNTQSFYPNTQYWLVQFGTGTGFTTRRLFGYLAQQYQSQSQSWYTVQSDSWLMLQSDRVSLIDINGDGLPDRVMLPAGVGSDDPARNNTLTSFVVEFNNGYGFERAEDWSGADPQYNVSQGVTADFCYIENPPYVGLFDINGDGLPDRVMEKRDDSNHTTWYVQINNGFSFEAKVELTGIDKQGHNEIAMYGVNTVDVYGNRITPMIDINGDGMLDRVMTDYDDYVNLAANYKGFHVQLNAGPFPDLMASAGNGFSGSTAIQYKPSTAWDNSMNPADSHSAKLLPFPVQTVYSVGELDGINAVRTTTNTYQGGFYDASRREFAGFAQVDVADPSGRKTTYKFHQGGGRDNASDGEYYDPNNFAKRGMTYRVETYGNDGKKYQMIVNQVDQADLGNSRWFPFVAKTFTFDYPATQTPVKATGVKYEYAPTTGNLTKKILYGEVSGVSLTAFTSTDADGGDTQYNHITYATQADTGNANILDHPSRIWLSADEAGTDTQVLQETKYTYKQSGSVATVEKRLCQASYSQETYEYDSYGNRNLTTDAASVQTHIDQFDVNYVFPTITRQRVSPELGVNSDDDHITTVTYDIRSGQILTRTDPSGLFTQNTFDNFGRLTQTDRTPIGGGTSVWVKKLDYTLNGVASAVSGNSVRIRVNDGVDTANGYETWVYTDGLGRVIQARTEAEENGKFRVASTVYDERGEILLVTWPHRGTTQEGSSYTKPTSGPALYTGYDAAGRVSEKRQRVDAVFTDGVYQSESSSTGDADSPLGARTWQYKDTNDDPWWIVATDEEGEIRRFRLDAFGRTNLIQEVEGANTYNTTLKYDRAGNLTNILNSASENIYYGYDDAGSLIAMADPHLGVWTYLRDSAGRVRIQTDGKGQKVIFDYNAPLSRLSAKLVYNKAGQLVSTATYTYDVSDDSNNYTAYEGLLYKVTDHEGWEKNDYDTFGRLRKNTRHLDINNQDYTTIYTYNDGDRVTALAYPNSGPTVNYEYHPPGSVKRVYRTGYDFYTAAASAFDDLGHVTEFKYRNDATVNSRSYYSTSQRLHTISTPGILSKTYKYNKTDDVTDLNDTAITYDDLHRIKTFGGLSGSYTYDSVGNITHNVEGNGSDYGYGQARKQAVKSAFGKTYLYDLCGNMIVRDQQALDYDPENRLARVSQSGSPPLFVEFGYAADGTRLWKKKNHTDLQVWIGEIYEEKGGKVLFHVFAGSERVCTFEAGSVLNGGSGPSTTHVGYYYHQDHLGSSSALSSHDGTKLEANDWYPFGSTQTTNPQANFQVSRRFTGQIFDAETGLYYYGARYFDPGLGRFIQADTIIPDLSNPQTYNRYSYAYNNPLKYTDPTGHWGKEVADWWAGTANTAFEYYTGGSQSTIIIGTLGTVNTLVGGLADPLALGSDAGRISAEGGTAGQIALAGVTELGRAAAVVPVGAAVGKAAGTAAQGLRVAEREAVSTIAGGVSGGGLRVRVNPRAGELGGVNISGANATKTFDQARREAFRKAGMTDPSKVTFTKVDPKTGTVVEFKGPGGAKVSYDAPHQTPGPGHNMPHVGWQTAGKRASGGTERGNIPYSGPQHPSRSPVKGKGVVEPH